MKVLSLGFLCLCATAQATESVRFYMAYGSSELATLNGRSFGEEVRADTALKVLSNSRFKVQMWMEIDRPGLTQATFWSTNIVFDRSFSSSGEGWPILSSHAFRKLAPAYENLAMCMSNSNTFAAYSAHGAPLDMDGNGVQDLGTWEPYAPSFNIYGTGGPGVSVRPVGLGVSLAGVNTVVRTTASAFLPSGRYRLWDYEFRNMMQPGETYGYGTDETGLAIPTDDYPSQNAANWFPDIPRTQFSGSRYNILAVPEPSSLLALGVGLLLVKRRRR